MANGNSKAAINFWLDVLLLVALFANILTAFIDPNLHILVSLGLLLIIGIHLFLHWRYLIAVVTQWLPWKWPLNVALLVTFVPTVLSGLIIALIYAPGISSFHRLSVAAFASVVIAHLYTNRKWITYQFKKAGKRV